MNKTILCVIVLAGFLAALGGCEIANEYLDLPYANDAIKAQEASRMNRGIPSATELPPGLGEDLPMPPPEAQTQVSGPAPITSNR